MEHLVHEMNTHFDIHTYKKMIFIYNALGNGWSVRKRQGSYIFNKKHQGKQEVFEDAYLTSFIHDNFKSDLKLYS